MDKTFEMDFEARAQHVREAIAEVLDDDTDVFVDVCEELDNWNGFLGDARCYDMSEIDEFFSKPSELLDKMSDFDTDDEFFYFDLGYVTTASDKYDVYSDAVGVDDVITQLRIAIIIFISQIQHLMNYVRFYSVRILALTRILTRIVLRIMRATKSLHSALQI